MGKIEYIKAFHAGATQLNHREFGLEWADSGQPVEVAIAWASAGYLPGEALPLIAQGMTPETTEARDAELAQIPVERHPAGVHKAVLDEDGNVTGFERLY